MSKGAGSPVVEHRFGRYGGQFVPETLMPALEELERAWAEARDDERYRAELDELRRDFGGRPTPLYLASRLSERAGRPVYFKREDLNHTGSHKLNNALGQVALVVAGLHPGPLQLLEGRHQRLGDELSAIGPEAMLDERAARARSHAGWPILAGSIVERLTASKNARSLFGSLCPGAASVPLAVSTALGRAIAIACATLPGSSPPLRISGTLDRRIAASSHSKLSPVPPRRP